MRDLMQEMSSDIGGKVSFSILQSRSYARSFGSTPHLGIWLFVRLVTFRCTLLTFILSAAAAATLNYLNASKAATTLTLLLIGVTLEEQARWLFSTYSNRIKWPSLQFTVMVIVVEFFAFYNPSLTFLDHIEGRMGSFLVHSVNGVTCAISMRFPIAQRVLFFLGAIAFHIYMNFSGADELYRSLAHMAL